MKKAAGKDFTVLLGMELRHYATGNDYLIYGVTEEFLYNAGNLMMKGLPQMRRFCDENGFLLYQAHPFRPYITRGGIKYLHGVEVYNGKCPEKENSKAYEWAKRNGKLMASGSDFHREEHLARGGIITDKRITSNKELTEALKSQRFEIIRTY